MLTSSRPVVGNGPYTITPPCIEPVGDGFPVPHRRPPSPHSPCLPLEGGGTAIAATEGANQYQSPLRLAVARHLSQRERQEGSALYLTLDRIRRGGARSTRGSDSPPDCHSLPLVSLRYPHRPAPRRHRSRLSAKRTPHRAPVAAENIPISRRQRIDRRLYNGI